MVCLCRRLNIEMEGEILWRNSGEGIGFQDILRKGKKNADAFRKTQHSQRSYENDRCKEAERHDRKRKME